MAAGDRFLFAVGRTAVLCGSADPAVIRYRQDVLRDCQAHEAVVRELYGLAVDTLESARKDFWPILRLYPNRSSAGRSASSRCSWASSNS